MSYQPRIYREQGGDVLVVRAFGGGKIKGTTSATATPAQAATIAVAAATGTFTTGLCAKLNSVITALKGVGILATG